MQKPDRLEKKGSTVKQGRQKSRNKTRTREQTKGDGKREGDNAKKKSILCLLMEKYTLLPSESFVVSLLLILSE